MNILRRRVIRRILHLGDENVVLNADQSISMSEDALKVRKLLIFT